MRLTNLLTRSCSIVWPACARGTVEAAVVSACRSSLLLTNSSSMAASTLVASPRIQLQERSSSAAGLRDIPYPSAMDHFRSIQSPINKYLALRDLLNVSPSSYYSLLYEHAEEILPFIYTPTVGAVCEQYHKLPLRPYGMYLTLQDRGHILDKLRAWPTQDVGVVVVTDGERILGLGDLGANGMGISEGKIALYTAAAGVDPSKCLPMCLDVGTNNKRLLADPAYKGLKQQRPGRQEFDAFLAEVLGALQQWRPHLLLQFEDFANNNAFHLLHDWRHRMCCFNDDIQGTASITLAGLLSAVRATGKPLQQHRLLFLGAGEAGTGIGELVATYMHLRGGVTLEAGRQHCHFMDSKGLVCHSRLDTLQHHKVPFAHDVPYCATLLEAVRALRPTAIVGVSTIAGAFDREVVEAMCELSERPIIFPLSNPTSKSECTFEEAFRWSQGKVLFASGSPFDSLTSPTGITHYPAQANNAYIFPALGYAAVLTRARELPDEAFVVAAEALAGMTDLADLAVGRLFPAIQDLRLVSLKVAAAVAHHLVAAGVGTLPADFTTPGGASSGSSGAEGSMAQWVEYVGRHMWHPEPAARSGAASPSLQRAGSLSAKL